MRHFNEEFKMIIQRISIISLLCLVTISIQAQSQFSNYGNCTKNTYGYINVIDATKSIKPIYCEAGLFAEGLAAVQKAGNWGYINGANKEIIAFQYDYARRFKQGRAIVKVGEYYGLIDEKGNFVVKPTYFDLMPYELDGELYYISRNHTFLSGIINSNGEEVLPHQFTYIIPYMANLSEKRLYENLSVFAMFREVDTTKVSFYEQFKESPYRFSPEKGRKDIYDISFNRIASREITSYSDDFTHSELTSIDSYIEDHSSLKINSLMEEIQQMLDAKEVYNSKSQNSKFNTLPTTEEEFDAYMAQMGYKKFRGNDGLIGVKKDGETILSPKFKIVNWWGGILFSPSKESVSYLKEQYSGDFDPNIKDLFKFFCIAAGDHEGGTVYTMKGDNVLELGRYGSFEASSLGFIYRTRNEDATSKGSGYKTGLINWKGKTLIPADDQIIKSLDSGRILVKKEKETDRGIEEQLALYNESGKVIIPGGNFSEIESFREIPNLYLAVHPVNYPSKEHKKNSLDDKNKRFVVLKVQNTTYEIVQTFMASSVSSHSLDSETGLMKYKLAK